jgi:hypothetical protein
MYKSVRISKKAYDYIQMVAKSNRRSVIATIDMITEERQESNEKKQN